MICLDSDNRWFGSVIIFKKFIETNILHYTIKFKRLEKLWDIVISKVQKEILK